ncbi:DNA helicase RecQ [Patescibacteria group bacterium]|nr:DNA helicase RecQ [Patescibacteria group bacterium]MBU4512296.1 DNA helicase RecQ [Patescibacteria group bacterium]MCG2693650.1 DNA helicase RecQ [Candidatus Parcubacteria bacterium]
MPQTILKKYFGYDTFRPLQKEAIDFVLAGKDILTVLATGSGKSLIYQIPAVKEEGVALVFSPLISLMKDQVDQLNKAGIPAAFLNSTLSPAEKSGVYEKARSQKIKILYIAPEGFFTERFQEFLKTLKISLIAIDEAHCISEWGHEFRPEYRRLAVLKNIFPEIPVVALTATATKKVQQDIIKQLNTPQMIPLIGSFERENLALHIGKRRDAIEQITGVLKRHQDESGIIYCATRKKVDKISDILDELGYKNLPYHAGMEKAERTRNQRAFTNEEVNLIVATVAFGMGINKSNVRFIIHANLTKSIEAYYQEIGRAGRDGLPADCFMFYSNGDIATQEYLINTAESEIYKDLALSKLDAMVRFARSLECRHNYVLDYFGEKKEGYKCGDKCDICLSYEIKEYDITLAAQKILSCVYRVRYPVGVSTIAQILAGSESERITKFRGLSTYGLMKDKTQEELKDLIDVLIDQGLIQREPGQYPVLHLTPEAKSVFSGGQKVMLKVKESREVEQELDYEVELFGLLRNWRRVRSAQEGVPPYIIFSDKVLVDLAAYLPLVFDDLGRVPGIGYKKIEQYGNDILGLIKKYCQNKGLSSRISELMSWEGAPVRRSYARGSDTVSETLALYKTGLGIKEIAEKRGLASSTIGGHIEQLFLDGRIPRVDLRRFVSAEREPVIREAFAKAGSTAALSPVKEMLGEDYSYDEIRLVRAIISETFDT